ncbi:DUF6477 family protein [Roseovarius sp. EL26]|uniref:DUF6477 family protein n=1 Tax=Roseovarius sp. EL26 TaxID=2126672 RepID=UPI000EA31497|nr:DUF6477 family protein [Roseovarius sp. EL26]
MQNYAILLSNLKRPRTLIHAARIGVENYCRETHLARCITDIPLPTVDEATAQLLELEERANAQRLDDDMTYSVKHHVEILIALMGEARLLCASPVVQDLK